MMEIVAFLVGYILGSINFAMIVGKIKNINFREVGTGNFGTMNVYRATQSVFWSGLTLLWDAGKGVLSILIMRYLGAGHEIQILAGLSAIFGHNHSFLLNFKSGRGIATFLGESLLINPLITVIWLLSWVPGYIVTGILSVGQILAAIYTPIIVYLLNIPLYQKVFTIGSGLLMLIAHLEKISAIRSGEEPRNYWNLKRKKRVKYDKK